MRKMWTVWLVGLFLLCAPWRTEAIDVTVGGQMEIRAIQLNDFDLNNYNGKKAFNDLGAPINPNPATGFPTADPHGNRDGQFINQRTAVTISARITDGLWAYAELENYSDWGLNSTAAGNDPRIYGGNGSSSIYGDRDRLNIRYGFVDFNIPKTPVWLRIGRQPLVLGHALVLSTTRFGGDAAVLRVQDLGPFEFQLGFLKLVEFNRANFDDANIYFARLDLTPIELHRFEFYGMHFQNRASLYPSSYPAPPATIPGTIEPYQVNQYTLGFAFDGVWDNFKYWGEVAYAGGRVDWRTPAHKRARNANDLTISGYAVAGGLSYNLFGFITLFGEAGMGSGDRYHASGKLAGTTGKRYEGFWMPAHDWSPGEIFGSNQEIFVDSTLGRNGTFTRSWDDFNSVILRRSSFGASALASDVTVRGDRSPFGSGINNLWFLKGGMRITPVEELRFAASAAYFSALTTDGLGFNGSKLHSSPSGQRINRDVGWELAGKISYVPYQNLMLDFIAAGFFPGKYWEIKQDAYFFNFVTGTRHKVDTIHPIPAWLLEARARLFF